MSPVGIEFLSGRRKPTRLRRTSLLQLHTFRRCNLHHQCYNKKTTKINLKIQTNYNTKHTNNIIEKQYQKIVKTSW